MLLKVNVTRMNLSAPAARPATSCGAWLKVSWEQEPYMSTLKGPASPGPTFWTYIAPEASWPCVTVAGTLNDLTIRSGIKGGAVGVAVGDAVAVSVGRTVGVAVASSVGGGVRLRLGRGVGVAFA